MSTVLNDPKSVHFSGGIFVGDYAHNLVALNIPDGVRMSLSFGFPKDSELTPLFSYHIAKMKQSGVIRRITHKWLGRTQFEKYEGDGQMMAFPLGYENVLLLYLLLVSGVVVGLVIGCFERVCGGDKKVESRRGQMKKQITF